MESGGLWRYFDKSDDKRATCKLCFDSYSYATSITNLRCHLRTKHKDICPSTYEGSKDKTLSGGRLKAHALWGYFTKVYGEYKVAMCNICRTKRSFKTTVTNLKKHLKCKHYSAYKRLLEGLPPNTNDSAAVKIDSESSDDNDDETQEEPQKMSDVWKYFEQEGTKVRCVVCRQVLEDTSYDSLKEHLFAQHPKLLLQLVQEQDQDTKSNASDHEDNTYTEVVYLEQDSPSDDTMRNSETPKITSTYKQNRPQKRIRINSSADHQIIKVMKDCEPDEESELDTFIKYIRCLLKKLPPEVFSKVQVDILKTIMDAQYSNKIPNINNTSISAPGTSVPNILTDVATCSGSNVISVNEIVPRKGPFA